MADITTYFSISTLNTNGLNSPTKRHRLVSWIKQKELTIFLQQEMHLTDKNKCWHHLTEQTGECHTPGRNSTAIPRNTNQHSPGQSDPTPTKLHNSEL
jgi:hypothetical protein